MADLQKYLIFHLKCSLQAVAAKTSYMIYCSSEKNCKGHLIYHFIPIAQWGIWLSELWSFFQRSALILYFFYIFYFVTKFTQCLSMLGHTGQLKKRRKQIDCKLNTRKLKYRETHVPIRKPKRTECFNYRWTHAATTSEWWRSENRKFVQPDSGVIFSTSELFLTPLESSLSFELGNLCCFET